MKEEATNERMMTIRNVDTFLTKFRQYKIESLEENQTPNVKFEVLQTIMNHTDLTINKIKGFDEVNINDDGSINGYHYDQTAEESEMYSF